MTRARLAVLLVAAAALAPVPARAQRDTIRLGAPRDTVTLSTADTAVAPQRNPRWATPFAVETSGQAAPGRTPRDVVWLDADSVRARRRAARLAAAADSAAEDSAAAEPADTAAAAPDTVATPPRRSRRAAAADSSASTPRRTSRTAARDTTDATPRRTSRTAARDTADTTPRRASRTAARDTATARRSASADSTARRSTARPRTHRVVEGETLFGIARKYGVTTAQIRALNPELVPGELAAGTVLRLPAGARAPAGDTARTEPRRRASAETEEAPERRPAAETRTPARGRRTHTVAAHETLYGIARQYGVTVDALKAANHLTGDALRVGQTLVIPAAAPR